MVIFTFIEIICLKGIANVALNTQMFNKAYELCNDIIYRIAPIHNRISMTSTTTCQ